jgi:hypothetical protein
VRILIIKGQSQYGGTRLFCDCAAEAFRRARHEVEVLDAADFAPIGAFILAHARSAGQFDLIFTINILSDFKDALGRTLSDLYGGPHVLWQTDYILSRFQVLPGIPRSTALLVVDPTQADAVRSIYGANRFDYLDFFPHPAVGDLTQDEADVSAFLRGRPIEILWSGGYQAPELPWAGAEGVGRQIFDAALELALSVEWIPPHEALDQVLASYGLDLHDPAHRQLREAAYLIDMEVRRRRRFDFLEALSRTGLPVRICGAGWDGQHSRFENAVFDGPVEMTRMVELMTQSRVVLNTNGNFGAGSHERPFSASLAGAATFSDFSRYYADVFCSGEDIELFYWQDLDAGIAALHALVADPERAFDQARRAKAKTLAHHTWDSGIDHIIAAADHVRSAGAARR